MRPGEGGRMTYLGDGEVGSEIALSGDRACVARQAIIVKITGLVAEGNCVGCGS